MSALEEFTTHRPRLFAIAYRMLGTVVDAEDILQEAYLRWMRVDPVEVASAEAFLTSVVTRLCIDHLRLARVQREHYVGPWLPEPVAGREETAQLAESLSTAFLVILESLSPLERAVFLLHDVFGYQFDEISEIVGKSVVRCRQVASHARKHVAERRPRFTADARRSEEIASTFFAACRSGDIESVMAVLADDAVSLSDGGGKATAARRPVTGAQDVARLFIGLFKKMPPGFEVVRTVLSGQPGYLGYLDGELVTALWLDVRDDRIQHVYVMRNPDKLRHLPEMGIERATGSPRNSNASTP